MPLPAAVKSDVISQFRTAGKNLLAALNDYVTLRRMYDQLSFVDGDFIGANAGITAAEFASAVSAMQNVNDNAATNNYDDAIYKIVSGVPGV